MESFPKGHSCVAGNFCFLNSRRGLSLSGTFLGENSGLSRRTGWLAVFYSCRVAAFKRAKGAAWDPRPRLLIQAYSGRFSSQSGPCLFCLPGERFRWSEFCQRVCNPAVLLLLSLQDSPGCLALHVKKVCVSFEDRLTLPAVGQHYGHGGILSEVPVTGHGHVPSAIEEPLNNHQGRGGEAGSALRAFSG